MFKTLLRALFGRRPAGKPAARKFYRPRLLPLEDRVVPATENILWVGTGMGNGLLWSVAANWSPAQIPDGDDNVIFSGQAGVGANTPTTMDLGGAGSYHVGRLKFIDGYLATLTLNANLYADVLDMRSAATISTATGRTLNISQRTGGPQPATIFETSYWTRGTIAARMYLWGESMHRATLEIGDPANQAFSVNLNNHLQIEDQYSTVKWVAGTVSVVANVTVTNKGDFHADAPGKVMGGNLADPNRWTFDNQKNLYLGKGKFDKVIPKGAKSYKISTLSPGTDLFEVAGTFTLDAADALISVESGTLLITGTLTQSLGEVTLSPGTALTVTGAYTLSGGSVSDVGYNTVVSVGSLAQSGGTFSVTEGARLSSTSTVTLSGGTFVLSSAGSRVDTASDFVIESVGALNGVGEVTITAGALVNGGTVNVGGAGVAGTLSVVGNYTQTGTLNVEIGASSTSGYDRLLVSGLATLGGTLNVTFIDGFMASPGQTFSILTYGSRSGSFATVNLPTISYGRWDPRYDDSTGTYTLWVLYY